VDVTNVCYAPDAVRTAAYPIEKKLRKEPYVKLHEKFGLPGVDDKAYWKKVKLVAKALKSDGCTGVADIYLPACWEHDIHCRTGQTVFGKKIKPSEEDWIFHERIQEMSPLGVFSPMAWWRYAGVRLGYLTGLVKRFPR